MKTEQIKTESPASQIENWKQVLMGALKRYHGISASQIENWKSQPYAMYNKFTCIGSCISNRELKGTHQIRSNVEDFSDD